jgi:signal transduction histidine kinase
MYKDILSKLKQQLDVAIEFETSNAYATLVQSLASTLKDLSSDYPVTSATCDDLGHAIKILEDTWFNGSNLPAQLPGNPDDQDRLSSLLSNIINVQCFALSLAKGDLSQSLKAKGLTAGGLKALQADLRHLTWQTQMIARGDLSQRVDFMGEFSDSFNSMVSSLSETREQLKHREEELSQANVELKRSNADLQQFAYAASHDLKEPLLAITISLKLLKKRYEGKLDQEAEKFISETVDEATRMQTLINDILSYSRVGTSGRSFVLTDFTAILNRSLSNLKIPLEQSSAVVTHDPLPKVMADPIQLVQLLQNLVSNAIKFCGDRKPLIHISAERKGKEWVFSVSDNGIGIPTGHRERIFEIFQRLHTRKEYPGTGIGLAMCKKIVERHGGHIWVKSETGKGSTFYFTISDWHNE